MKKILFILFIFCHTFIFSNQKFPERIISLGPYITKQIYLLGLEDKLIANTTYCMNLGTKNKEKIGSLLTINIEKIVELNPDMVFAVSLTNLDYIKRLKDLKINVIQFQNPKNFQELCHDFLTLGKIVGRKKLAIQIVNEAKQKIKYLNKTLTKLSKPKVIIQVGANPLFLGSRNALINDFVELAGGINIGPDRENGLFSREKVIELNPDIIIITSMGISGEEEKAIWKKYKTLNAVKNNKIYIVDSNKLCSPTPKSFVETLEEMIKILH